MGTKHLDAGAGGQGGAQGSGSGLVGSGGTESGGGHGTGGVSGATGGSLAGGSTGTGLSSVSVVGGRGGTSSTRIEGSSSGGSSTKGGETGGNQSGGIPAGGTTVKGGSIGGNTGGAGGQLSGTAGSSGIRGGTTGTTGGKGGASDSTANGGSAGGGSGGSTGTGSGGTTSAGGTFAASGPLETALAPIITSFCAAARHCCPLAGFNTTALVDCESAFVKRNPLFGLVNLGQATIDSKVVAACKAAYDEAASSCSASDVYRVCAGILAGKQGENAPCGKGGTPMIDGGPACDHSAGTTACIWTGDSNDPAVTGTCQKVAHGKKGDACLQTCESGDECSFEQLGGPNDTLTTLCFEDEGFFCSYETTPASCQPLLAQGASCSGKPDSCKSTDYCDSVSKTCKAASTAGQSCLYSSCLDSLSCGADKKCVEPFYELASEGASCQGIAQIY